MLINTICSRNKWWNTYL